MLHFPATTGISIHALLAESDVVHIAEHASPGRISIHALLAESDRACPLWTTVSPRFLSTLSLRRATRSPGSEWQRCRYFYPRSPCGERPVRRARCTTQYKISIHALLAESDQSQTARTGWCSYFYPRSPCGERPHIAVKCRHGQILISIHALLAESDEAHRRQPGSRL